MSDKGYESIIESKTIFYNRNEMSEYKFKINLNDVKSNFNTPESIVNYLVNYYEYSFKDQISIIEKIKFRDDRLNYLLKKSQR